MTNDASKLRSVGAAVAMVVAANIAAFVLPLLLIAAFGGLRGAAKFYTDGGFFMHPITLVALLQVAAASVLGAVHMMRPLPIVLFLLTPALAALLGIGGAWVGLEQGWEAIAVAPPDMRIQLWSMVLAISENTRIYGFHVAAVGCFGLVVAASMAAFVRRGMGGSGRAVGLAVIVGAGGGIAAVAAAVVRSVLDYPETNLVMVAAHALLLLACAAVMGLGTLGVVALTGSDDPRDASLGFTCATAAALGVVLSVAAYGALMAKLATAQGFEALATSPPDMKGAMISAAASMKLASAELTLTFMVVGLLLSAGLVASGAGSLRAWLSRGAAGAGLAVVPALVILGLGALLDGAQADRQEHVVAMSRARLPEGMTLPSSSSEIEFHGGNPVVAIHGGKLFVDNEPAGEPFTAAGLEKIAVALGRADEARGEQRSEISKLIAAIERADNTPDKLANETGCNTRRQPIALALDPATRADEVRHGSDWLRQRGVCNIQLLATRPDPEPTLDAVQAVGALESMGLLGQIVLATQIEHRAVAVTLAERLPPESGDEPRLDLMLRVRNGEVTISGSGAVLEPIGSIKDGQVDQDALKRRLAEIKDSFPDDSRIHVHLSGDATLQQLVDAMDAAREVVEPTGEYRTLFDEVVWLSSDAPRPPPLDREKASLGIAGAAAGIMGALPKEVIQKVITMHKNEIRYCYEVELQRDLDLEGKLMVKWIIAATGAVANARVTESTMDNRDLQRCILAKIEKWKFPSPAGGGFVEVNYPFVFKSK